MDREDKVKFLADSIKNAKKVMNKVESGTSKKSGNTMQQHVRQQPQYVPPQTPQYNPATQKTPVITEAALSKSKMPKEILESFRKNPIADPSSVMGLGSLVEMVKQPEQQYYPEQPYYAEPTPQPQTQFIAPPQQQNLGNVDPKLLEWVIKKTVEETVELMQKKTSLDENIQIKIGGKLFGGKISTLKETVKK